MSNNTSSVSFVPSWKTEFTSRVEAFAKAILVEREKVFQILSDYGADGSSDQSLNIIENESNLPMSELFSMFVDSGLTKKGLLRIAVPHLRGFTSLEESDSSLNIAKAIKDVANMVKPKSEWSDEELLKIYDESSHDVWEILRKRSHGRPFVIFNSDGTVNIEESLSLLKVAKKQPTSDKHRINNKLVNVRRAGEFLVSLIEESPFCPGFALVNDYCSKTDTNWAGVSQEARIICRLHFSSVESSHLSKTEMKKISKIAGNTEVLREELSQAALIYDNLKAEDSLPKLKMRPDKVYSKTDTGF